MSLKHVLQPAILVAIAAALAVVAGAPAPTRAAVTYNVNSTNDVDDGTCDATHCSLREAINAANANGGKDAINFGGTLGNLIVIRPLSQLPTISDPLTLTGSAGFSVLRRVTLDGSLAPPGVSGLVVAASSTDIRAMTIHSFPARHCDSGGRRDE